jgi:hypothetical protein
LKENKEMQRKDKHNNSDKKWLEIEYQRAQNSGEFYEKMFWSIAQTMITLSLIILYYLWQKEENLPKNLKIGLLIFGTFIIIYTLISLINVGKKREREFNITNCIEEEEKFIGKDRYNVKKFPYLITGSFFWYLGVCLIILFYLITGYHLFEWKGVIWEGIIIFIMGIIQEGIIIRIYKKRLEKKSPFQKNLKIIII